MLSGILLGLLQFRLTLTANLLVIIVYFRITFFTTANILQLFVSKFSHKLSDFNITCIEIVTHITFNLE